MNQVKIGRFIAEMRRRQNLTQREFADILGISDKTVSKWECGNGMPKIYKSFFSKRLYSKPVTAVKQLKSFIVIFIFSICLFFFKNLFWFNSFKRFC